MAAEHGLEVDMEKFEESKKKAVVSELFLFQMFMGDVLENCFISLQEASMGGGDKARDAADLNVHAIAELQKMGIATTDDSPKYKYTDDGKRGLEAQYSQLHR